MTNPENYTYDADGQVLGDGTNTFTFDALGNRSMAGYQTGTGNQLQSDGTWNYTYDAEGNTATKTNISTGEVWQYTFDSDNRLTKAEHKPSSTGSVDQRVQFVYDVLGNRIQKSVGVSSPPTTKFAYDLSGNAWLDFTGTSTLVAWHIFAGGVDQLIAKIDSSGNTSWYLTDLLGSVRDLTNSSGSLIDHLDYTTFGKVAYESSPGASDRYGFQGRETDSETGLGYFRARYVSFDTGRFLSQDPLGFGGGDPNVYRFVGNQPNGRLDPSGLEWVWPWQPD